MVTAIPGTIASVSPSNADRPKPRRLTSLYLEVGLALLLALLVGAPGLLYPFGRDQGEYATIATAALRGQVVYRDVFNIKPPLTHLVHEFTLLVFGRSMLSIRLFDLFWQAATTIAIVLLARRIYRRSGIGLLAGGFYLIAYYTYGCNDTAQTDGFMILPLVLAVLLFLEARDRGRDWLYAASGAAVGLAILFKYPGGLLLPLLALMALRSWGKGVVRRLLALGAGCALPLAICALWLACDGALAALLATHLRYVRQYNLGMDGGHGYLGSVWVHLAYPAWHNILIWLSTVALVIELAVARARRTLDASVPVVVLWLATVGSAAIQNKSYPYHALPSFAPLAILLAHQVFICLAAMRRRRPWGLAMFAATAVMLVTLFAGFCIKGYPFSLADLVGVARGRLPLADIYARPDFGPYAGDDISMAANMTVARYLQAHSEPQDEVFIWGFEPSIYFLSQRAFASRFVYDFPLYGAFAWPQLRAQFVAELEGNAPLYIIIVSNDPLPFVTGTKDDSRAALTKFAGLRGFLEARYHLETVIEDFTLYRRSP